jgi:hypothetical protein
MMASDVFGSLVVGHDRTRGLTAVRLTKVRLTRGLPFRGWCSNAIALLVRCDEALADR